MTPYTNPRTPSKSTFVINSLLIRKTNKSSWIPLLISYRHRLRRTLLVELLLLPSRLDGIRTRRSRLVMIVGLVVVVSLPGGTTSRNLVKTFSLLYGLINIPK